MKTFYVSLTRDLIGVYLEFTAESESAVRAYLEAEYFEVSTRTWKLPWCAVYEAIPPVPHQVGPIVVKPLVGPLLRGDYA